MTTTTTAPTGIAIGIQRRRAHVDRWFYPIASVIVLIIALIGFQQFYFHGRSYPNREITPPIRMLVIVHGIVMAAWVLMGIVQPLLIAGRKHRVHMTLGWLGVFIATLVVVLGVMVGVQSARVAPPGFELFGYNAKQFMAIPVLSVLVFGVLVGAAVWKRKTPAIHKSMMLAATLVILSAALNRIDALNALYVGTMFDTALGPFFMAAVLGVLLLGLRCALIRGFDRWLGIGVVIVALTGFVIAHGARTDAWGAVAGMLMG